MLTYGILKVLKGCLFICVMAGYKLFRVEI